MATIPVYIAAIIRTPDGCTVCRQRVRGIPFRIPGSRYHYALTQLRKDRAGGRGDGWTVTCLENGYGFGWSVSKTQARDCAKRAWRLGGGDDGLDRENLLAIGSRPLFKRGKITPNLKQQDKQ